MKKFLSYILISLVIGANLLAPISVGWNKNNLEVKSNKAEAAFLGFFSGKGDNDIRIQVDYSANDTAVRINVNVTWSNKGLLSSEYVHAMKLSKTQNDPTKTLYDETKNIPLTSLDGNTSTGHVDFTGLDPLTTYKFDIVGSQTSENLFQVITTAGSYTISILSLGLVNFGMAKDTGDVKNPIPYDITTLSAGVTTFQPQATDNSVIANDAAILPICTYSSWTVGSCVGVFLYRIVFQPSAYLFAITGKLLDYTLFYSIQDTSYRSQFVVEGWGIVRDFCNMFFIFVLLYIAFGTILKINSVKTKEMIINVIIIGLLINFSLFATQVIIDASNILTRVFYNQILVGPKVDGKIVEELGLGGSKQLTAALITKINPQRIIISADEASKIATKATTAINTSNDTVKGQVDSGTFIMVTIMASIMNIVGLWTFLMVSMVFIARVVGLWLAMILVPVAFFSYTIPQMQDVEMIGWKKWWPETLKLAFLAPVFLFFLYIIIQFLSSGLGVMNADGKSGLDFFIAIIVPFAFLMILLIKAKDITTKMSGKIGETITSAAKTVGGVALGVAGGAALGLGAGALRGTVGKLGNKLATSEWASTHGAVGRGLGNVGKWAGSGSMDVRGVKIGGKSLADTGVKFGKAKEGGYTKHLSDKVEKRQKRAKELEVRENEPLKQALNKTEMDLQGLLVTNAKEIESVDKLIEKKRQEAGDAERKLKAAAPGGATTAAKAVLKTANDELDDSKNRKTALREGNAYTDIAGTTYNYDVTAKVGTQSIDTLEKLQKTQAQDIKTENATRKGGYATTLAKRGGRANKEAEHKIIMDTKLDSGTKT